MNYLICCYSGICFSNQLLHFAGELIILGFDAIHRMLQKNRHDEHALYCRLKTTVHFKHTSTAVTTVGISYSKSLVMTQNTIYFSSSKSSASVHKRTSGYRRIPFLSSLLLPPGEVSNRTQAVNSENTNHVRTRSKYHAIKKKCTCVVKFHVLACITLHNYDNNSSAVAVITDDRL